jgi:hypothetical protein
MRISRRAMAGEINRKAKIKSMKRRWSSMSMPNTDRIL